MDKYYKIPVDIGNVLNKQKLNRCELIDSIKNYIHLLIMSEFKQYRADDNFGCGIWDLEFEIIPHVPKWQLYIKNALEESLTVNENRLDEIKVDVILAESHAKFKKVTLTITGVISETAEPFNQSETVYLCPRATK